MLVRIEPALVHLDETYLALTTTSARRAFKSNAGQNNHFLVTVLVGLDSVADGLAVLKPEFSTSWSPKNVRSSALRSREYVLRTSLAWIADAVDEYRKSLTRMPGLLSESVASRVRSADGSGLRLRELSKHLIGDDPIELDMARFAIHWRNRMVHFSANSNLDHQVAARLATGASTIAERHRGLDVQEAIARMNSGKSPTFKEVASMISAAHRLIQELDAAALRGADPALFADSIIAEHLRQSLTKGSTNGAPMFWPGNPTKSEQRIRQLLLQNGFAPTSEFELSIPQSYLEELYGLSVKEALARFIVKDV